MKRLEKLNSSQSNETASLKRNSKLLLEQVARLQEQLQGSLLTNDELRAELEKVRRSLEDLENSSQGLEGKIISLSLERDVAIGIAVGAGVVAVGCTIWALVERSK